VALLAGLPAISTGSAPCGGDHSLGEWCQIEPIYRGIKKLILLEAALTEKVVESSTGFSLKGLKSCATRRRQ